MPAVESFRRFYVSPQGKPWAADYIRKMLSVNRLVKSNCIGDSEVLPCNDGCDSHCRVVYPVNVFLFLEFRNEARRRDDHDVEVFVPDDSPLLPLRKIDLFKSPRSQQGAGLVHQFEYV